MDSPLGLTKVRAIVMLKLQAMPTASGPPQVDGPTANVSRKAYLTECDEVRQLKKSVAEFQIAMKHTGSNGVKK